ncbi:YadA-like family protein [Streptobacillus moniliformis]|uniref:YadA-like family protein n=1 Tax=Streptobacillus moniliformis TaxID=34105 RepID=UPI0007E31948|nr:YadA-like family protein [Streptobacillus moniliformis]
MNKIQELRRFLKSSLKNKVSVNEKTVLRYMMLGFVGLSTISNAAWLAINETNGTVGTSTNGSSPQGENNTKNNIILSKYDSSYNTDHSVVIGAGGKTYAKRKENVVIGYNAQSEKQQSVVIGANTKSDLQNSVVLGNNSYVYKNNFNTNNGVTDDDGQGVAVGNSVYSTAQATSLGNNTYAIGRSSIAIGNDDVSSYVQPVTEYDYKNYFKNLYDKIDNKGDTYGYANGKKVQGKEENHKWSPTLAQGHGSIAIGSRSIAYADGSTALGTLAYALKNGSTAIGTLTRAEGEGAIAIGRETNVFSNNAISAGNKTLVLEEGGAAYGLQAVSGGKNSIAIGTDVYSNVDYDYDSKVILGGSQRSGEWRLFGDLANYGQVGSTEDKRGLYGFDLNGVAKTILGIAEDQPRDNIPDAKKGDYLKSGDYFSYYKNYIDGIENGLTNAKTKDTKETTNSIRIKTQEKKGVKDIAKGNGKNAIVIGSKSGAFGDNAIALGRGSFSLKENSISIGSYSYTKDKNAIAIGIASRALAEGSVTFGNGAGVDISGKNSMVYGHGSVAYAPNSIILGINSRLWDESDAGDSIIIGNNANVYGLNGKKGHKGKSVLALGNETLASLDNSVALGFKSQTDYNQEDLDKPGYTARGSYSIPSSAKVGVISVGKKGYERRIINVAAGYRDSDAVNVAQLKTLEDRLDGATEVADDKVRYFSVNTENDLSEIARKKIDYKNYVKLKVQKLTVEARKKAGDQINEENVKGLEEKLKKIEDKAGIKDKATSINALVDMNNHKYMNNGTFDIDKYMEDLEKAKESDLSETTLNSVLSDEEKTKLSSNNYDNKGAKAKDSIAIGYDASTETGAENAIAIGMGAKATSKDSIVLGSYSKNTATLTNAGYDFETKMTSNLTDSTWKPTKGELAIGDGTTNTRRITGVAAGDKDTDAVNVAQLKKVTSGLLNDKELLTFIGNDTSKEVKVKIGEKLNIVGEGTVANGTAANNIKVTADSNSKKLTIGLAKNLVDLESISVKKNGNEIKISSDKITVSKNGEKVEITKDSLMGATTVGKDKDNSIMFGSGTDDKATTKLKVAGKELTFTKSGDNIKISNVANGIEDKDAVNVSQLKKYVEALGGNAKIDDKGKVTGPKYNLKAGDENAKDYTNVGEAIKALDDAINKSSDSIKDITNKEISFYGNDGEDKKVSKKLGQSLAIKGEGTVANGTAKDNIKVEKSADSNGLDIKLAEDLKNLKSIETKKDGNKQTKITTDGVEVTNDKGKASLTGDKLTFGAKDANSADKTSTTIEKSGVTVKGKDGKDAVSIKSGENGGTIVVNGKDGKDSIKIDGDKGTITGLKDIAHNASGDTVVNKNYVDNKIKEIANGPFEYETKDKKEKVIRGQDGKLYKEEDLKKHYYDEKTSSYKPKNSGSSEQLTAVDSKDVNVNLMPKGDGKKPISIGNVEGVLGENPTDEKVKDLLSNKNGVADNSKNKVATGSDILALAKAGLNFAGNTGAGDEIHRNLGEKVTIKGEGTDSKNDFNSASGNIQVKSDKMDGSLTVKLSDKLTNMTSFETKDLDDNGTKSKVKLDKDGLTSIKKTDDNKFIQSKIGVDGINIGKYDNEPNNNSQPTESAKYTIGGTTIKDGKGESNLTSTTLSFKDNNGKIKGLADPVEENDAVNKRYVDNKIGIALNGVANAIAMANLPQVSTIGDKRHNIAGSYGYYNGENAFALGLSGVNETGTLVYRASGALNTKGHVSLGAGLGYQFDNIGKRSKEILKLQRNGNINLLDEKVYELNNEVKALKEENKAIIEKNMNLENRISELEKLIKKLIEK